MHTPTIESKTEEEAQDGKRDIYNQRQDEKQIAAQDPQRI